MIAPRRRSWRIPALVVAICAALAACGPPSNAPTDYGEETQQNFIEGCTATNATGGTIPDAIGGNQTQCECAYNWFVVNVPFDQFKQYDQDLATNTTALPAQTLDAVTAQCFKSANPPSGASSGTTVAGPSGTATDDTATSGAGEGTSATSAPQ